MSRGKKRRVMVASPGMVCYAPAIAQDKFGVYGTRATYRIAPAITGHKFRVCERRT